MALIALALAPAAAHAATVDPTQYTAAPGEANHLTVTDNGPTLTFVDTGATTTAGGGCLPVGPNLPGTPVTCPQSIVLTLDLNDLDDDTTFVGEFDVLVSQFGGAGSDTLRGPAGSFFAQNNMDGGPGPDILAGGPGPDAAQYATRVAAVNVSLDDVANDGEPGEGDNVLSTVETVNGGAGNDTLTGNAADNTLNGFGGNDVLSGGAGDDQLGGGDGGDVLLGGDGDDALVPSDVSTADGADSVSGGAGVDQLLAAPPALGGVVGGPAVTATLDDVADDGVAGEGDNYHSDIEDAFVASPGNNRVVGTAAINILATGAGNDTITGGAGNDVLSSAAGDDTIDARDAFADRVECGPGTDTAIVDTLDVLSGCENVQVADVGNANDTPEDSPPTVAFTAPAENARLPARGTTVTVTAGDDRGVARVVLIDDGRIVATDTTAPYAFAYRPRAEDVGTNTLIAQAVDSAGQASTAVRVVRVDRFAPRSLSAHVTPSRDRTLPFTFRTRGTLQLPTGISRTQGCRSGTVNVQVKRSGVTISNRRTRLSRACTYSSSVTFRVARRLGSGRLRVIATFSGNPVVKPRRASSVAIRAR